MAHFLLRLGDLYVEWSTIVDAPITAGMTRDELHDYIRAEYGNRGLDDLPARLARLDAKGTSARDAEDAEDVIAGNRAGPNETELTLDELIVWAREAREA